jgi:hypothetical protein
MKDGDRFGCLVRKIVGKCLTYAQLTGKEGDRPGKAQKRSKKELKRQGLGEET